MFPSWDGIIWRYTFYMERERIGSASSLSELPKELILNTKKNEK